MIKQNNAAPKILYVEDNETQRVIIAMMLARYGFTVETARHGREGVALAQTWGPDLILMDIMMPVMNGLEAAEQLQANPYTRHIPILALTAASNARVKRQIQTVGMKELIPKLISPDELIAKLRYYLDK